MTKTIRFYNNYKENIVLLPDEKVEKIQYLQSMKTFYKTLPNQIDINMYDFNIDMINHLFENKTIELILNNIDIVDYLCLSISDLFSDINTEIFDLIPFISYLAGKNQYLNMLIENQDIRGILMIEGHPNELFKILSSYNGGNIHPIVYQLYEDYLMYIYDSIWKIGNITLEVQQKMCIFPYEYLRKIIMDTNKCYDVLLKTNYKRDVYWRDTDTILEYLKKITNGFICSKFFELNPNMTITGGLLSALLSMSYIDIDEYINISYPDLDIFVISNSKIGRMNAIKNFLEYLKKYKCFCAYKNSILSIYIKGSIVPIQIILSDYNNIFDMFSSFDMSHLQIAYNGNNGLIMTVPCYLSHRDRVTFYNKLFYVKPYRIVKAMRRGYSIIYNKEIEYYIQKFGNQEEFLELGIHVSRKFPKKFIMRRFMRYLGKEYTRIDKSDIMMYINQKKIKVDGNFRIPIFDKSYSNPKKILNIDFDYVPKIKKGVIELCNDVFVFGYNRITHNDDYYIVTPDYSRNVFMWLMFRDYLDKVLSAYPLCKNYSLGIDDKNSFKILNNNPNLKRYHFARRISVYINNVSMSQSTLYIYLGIK